MTHNLTADVHESVPKQLKVSDAVRSHAGCMYRPPGMSWSLSLLDTQWY